MISIFRQQQLKHEERRLNTMTQRRVPFFFVVSLILSFFLFTTNLLASSTQENSPTRKTPTPTPEGFALSRTFIHMAQQAKNSVVNIVVKKTIISDVAPSTRLPILGKPLLRQFFEKSSIPEEEMSLPESREQEMTSGVIIQSDGYILTNKSVLDHAYDIRVQLIDERVLKAEIIGQDQSTDLAVLKINAFQLPTFRWGNSDVLQVGEIVMAVGNPFGLSQVLTIGVISATGRGNVGFVDYESFIQTDAAMNPGNFGGALLNMKGELIGINTSILHESSGNTGIGFAIPSQMAKTVATSLMKQGKVLRGWLGIATQKLTPDLAKHFKTSHGKGVIITDLAKDGPVGRAKFQRRDVILEYKDMPVTTPRQLQSLIAETEPGTSITIKRLQGGKEKDVVVKVEEFPVETSPRTSLKRKGDPQLLTGVTVESVPRNFPGTEGVLVVEIAPGTLGDKQGLQEGDIILDINQTPIRSVEDFEKLARQLSRQDTALLLLRRENATMYLPLQNQLAPMSSSQHQLLP